MQAIILAAGMGKRLKELTQNNTKCMVKVNGETLISRALHQLDEYNLDRIILVVGYKGKELKDYVNTISIETPIVYVENDIYNKTNNIYSLYLAKDYLKEDDTILLESDLIFDDGVLKAIIEDERDTLALVDQYESWMDGTCLKLDEDDTIMDVVPGSKFQFQHRNEYYKTVNIYKFSKAFSRDYYLPFLEAYCNALGNNEYYEQVLRVITILDKPVIRAKRLSGQAWYEIDDAQDLDIAESIFSKDNARKVALMEERYGGYWRYPKLMDFCYLVNPFYPSKKMLDEIKANFDILLTQYPSGMKVNSLLASKNFNVHQENIVVGNGAAELIKSLMEKIEGKVGIVRPTFEEYPNRFDKEKIVAFEPENDDCSYKVEDLIKFYQGKDLQWILLINPDNPSGNFIPKEEMFRFINWTKNQGIKLLVDESFVDFSEESFTLFDQEVLNENQHLYVMKSLSKSHGTPGLRLGIMASGDHAFISFMKKDVAIWNINSFAEFYMQIMEKYKKDYERGLEKFKKERRWLVNELEQIDAFTVIPSQANYLMIRLNNGLTAQGVTEKLLIEYGILIKDLSAKLPKGEYIRIAVKNHEENQKLMEAMKSIVL